MVKQQQKMQIKYVGSWMVLVLLCWCLLGSAIDDKQVIRGLISVLDPNSPSDQSDEAVVEVLASRCRLELIHLKRIYEDLGVSNPDSLGRATTNILYDQAVIENLRKSLSYLGPQRKHILYRCSTENHLISSVYEEDATAVGWFQKHLGSVLPTSNQTPYLRRNLAEAPAPASPPPPPASPPASPPSPPPPPPASPPPPPPASSPAPSPSSPPTPAQAPAPAPKPKPGPKQHGSKQKAPPSKDEELYLVPIPPPPPDSGSNSDSHSDGKKTIVVVIAVTAVGTFIIATFLFFCCRKAFGGGSTFDHKDDRPLLSLSMSDYSVSGSSTKSWSYNNSADKDKMNNQSYGSNFNNTIGAVSTESASGGSAAASSSALKPPPGRAGVSTPGFSALKPPPGRADPLPPEPPASLRPASGMGNPPPLPPASSAPPPPPPPKKAGPPPPGPPPPPGKPGPRAPPPPKGGPAPRPPPVAVKAGSSSVDADANAAKAKLKPFFWDKVMANPDHSMVWDQIKSGSFQFNEDMIESLFGYSADNKNDKKSRSSAKDPSSQLIQLIEPKKAQNLSILLRAMNVTTEEVHDALEEGNELPCELLETLLKMAPTPDEELKLRLFSGEVSQLGPAERFLKVMVDIPFAFKRMEVLLFMGTLHEESTMIKENFATLEAASKELRGSRLFFKLLEAVLKTGNRMNDGTYRGGAQAFKLDTLLKLADVKGTDGKTTLLHFVVQEIIRSEGVRAVRALRDSKSASSIKSDDLLEHVSDDTEDHYCSLGLEVVSGLSNQLQNIRNAAGLDSDSVTGTIAKLGNGLLKAKNFLNKEMDQVYNENGFLKGLRSFIQHAEADIVQLMEEEKRIMALVKSTADFFHGNSGKEEGLRLFIIVRDFLIMLEKVCREVKARPNWPTRTQKKEPPSRQSSSETPRTPFSPDFRQRLFPAIAERRMDSGSSSDDD